ncbi:hypothetical protein [Sphingomonas faeni]|uniref:hypothetical protein n=1 Tax=Sphingomonas faeni TaxID=185950 RepID=UPI0033534992
MELPVTEAEKDAIIADFITGLNTLTPETAYADEVRWRMMTDDDRAAPTELPHFGGGPRLSSNRCWMVREAAAREGVDAAYLTFGQRIERGPSMAYVTFHTPRRVRSTSCDFWVDESGTMHFVSRGERRDIISLETKRLVITGLCDEAQFDAGRRRARDMFKRMVTGRPGELRDQHFFENCSILQPVSAMMLSGHSKPSYA